MLGVLRSHNSVTDESAQKFADAINRPHFPSTLLRPGERYTHTTVHEFGTSDQPPAGPY